MSRASLTWMTDAQEGPRRPVDSLCYQPVDAPRSFHYFTDGTVRVYKEMVDAAYGHDRTSLAAAGLMGDFLGQLRRAAHGELRSGGNNREPVGPVRLNPDIWEIRWKLGRLGEFRLYHAEPDDEPQLVALRFHEKDSSSEDADTIDDLQEDEMRLAGTRYDDGVNNRWGHVKGCRDCLSF